MKNLHFLVLALAVCLGCRSGGDTQSAPADQPSPEIPAPTVQNKPNKKAFHWKNALQLVGFNQLVGHETASTGKRMAKLSKFVGTVVAKSHALDANDPPDVTRSKAQGLLDSLNSWEKLGATGTSSGALNPSTTEQIDLFVQQLRNETKKLVTFTPSDETIAGVKYLASMLQTTIGETTDIRARASRVVTRQRTRSASERRARR